MTAFKAVRAHKLPQQTHFGRGEETALTATALSGPSRSVHRLGRGYAELNVLKFMHRQAA